MRITYTDRLLRIRSIYRNIIEDSLNMDRLYTINGEKIAEIGAEGRKKIGYKKGRTSMGCGGPPQEGEYKDNRCMLIM